MVDRAGLNALILAHLKASDDAGRECADLLGLISAHLALHCGRFVASATLWGLGDIVAVDASVPEGLPHG